MCELITFAPNASGMPLPERAGDLHAGRQLHVEKVEADRSALLHPGKPHVFSLTSGGCSCGLLPETRDAEDVDRDEARIRRKASKLHWSKAKTERAVADSIASSSAGPDASALQKATREYLADVAESCRGLSLLVNSDVSERLPVLREERLSAAQLRSEAVSIKHEVRYLVRP